MTREEGLPGLITGAAGRLAAALPPGARPGPLAGLGRLLGPQPERPRPGERCEFCGLEVPDAHSHVADLENRGVMCACRSCYLLFTQSGAAGGRFRSIPERYRYDPEPQLSGGQWDELQIPVRMAFFFRNSAIGGWVCFYPGPGGATESLLPLDAWAAVLAANPAMSEIDDDVEALLVQRVQGRFELFAVPIDACYELVGIMRARWKGFDGGTEVWAAAGEFFSRLRTRAGGP